MNLPCFFAGPLTLCYFYASIRDFHFSLGEKGLANLSHSHLIHRLFCDFDNGSLDTIHIYSQINLSSNRKCVCACVWAYVKEPYLERERARE